MKADVGRREFVCSLYSHRQSQSEFILFFGYKRPNKDPAKETKGGEAKKKTEMIEGEKLNLPSRNFA